MNYLQSRKGAQWSESALLMYTPKQLKLLAAYVPAVSIPLPKELESFWKKCPGNAADQALAMKLAGQKATGEILKPGSVEEGAMAKGGYVRYDEGHMYIYKTSGEIDTYFNAVIPILQKDKRARPGAFALTAMICAFFRVDAGELVYVCNPSVWADYWKVDESVLKADGIIEVKAMMDDIICVRKEWVDMPMTVKQSLTGSRWAAYVIDVVEGLPTADYLITHSLVAEYCLKMFRRKTHGGALVPCVRKGRDDKGRLVTYRMIAESSYITVTPQYAEKVGSTFAEEASRARNALNRDPVIMIGPFSGMHLTVPSKDADFKKALKSYQNSSVQLGGDNSAIAAMASGNGYSGFVTPLTRRLVLTIAAAATLARNYDRLDIHVTSVGDIPIVHQSLVNLGEQCPISRVKFMLPFSEHAKVHKDYRKHLVAECRHRAHQLWISSWVMPTDSDQAAVLALSGQEIDGCGEDFTYYGPIFGSAPWGAKRHVFVFGDPANFRSFCTTMSGFYLTGAVKDGDDWVLSQETLAEAASQTQFYTSVVQANSRRTSFFLQPKVFFSSISNLLSAPRKGVIFSVSGDQIVISDTGANVDWVADESDSHEDDYADVLDPPTFVREGTADEWRPKKTQSDPEPDLTDAGTDDDDDDYELAPEKAEEEKKEEEHDPEDSPPPSPRPKSRGLSKRVEFVPEMAPLGSTTVVRRADIVPSSAVNATARLTASSDSLTTRSFLTHTTSTASVPKGPMLIPSGLPPSAPLIGVKVTESPRSILVKKGRNVTPDAKEVKSSPANDPDLAVVGDW